MNPQAVPGLDDPNTLEVTSKKYVKYPLFLPSLFVYSLSAKDPFAIFER